jgi:ABC-type cobalt transport system substrate-binding protein
MISLLNRLGVVVAILALGAFFLPWIRHDLSWSGAGNAAAHVASQLTGDAERPWWEDWFSLRPQEIEAAKTRLREGVSGYQLPPLLRGDKIENATARLTAEILLNDERIQDKAILIYVPPLAAALTALFLLVCQGSRGALVLPLLTDGTLYFFMRHKINETYFDRLVAQLHIGWGLWITLYALLALTGILLLRILIPSGGR